LEYLLQRKGVEKDKNMAEEFRNEPEQRPNITKPRRKDGHKAWRSYINQLGKFAQAREWQEMLEVLGTEATQYEWDLYLEIAGFSENAGNEESNGYTQYGHGFDEAFDEDWIQAEDDASTHRKETDHNPFCPLRFGTGLNVKIDQPGDDPVGDEVERRLDGSFFNQD